MTDDRKDDDPLPTELPSRPTAAIVGPGSIGGVVAAWLASSDAISVTLCVRTPFDRLIVETPTTLLDVAPHQISRPDDAQAVDWVLIATKTYDVDGTVAWLAKLVGPKTRVAVLQNGVEHVRRFADHVPRDRLLPVMVDIPTERDAPGRIRQRRRGTMEVPKGAAGQAFAALFDQAEIDVSESPDFVTAIWRKLCINSAGAVSVLSDEPGGVAWREPAAAIMRALIGECIAVGRAEGADLDDALTDSIVQGYRDAPRETAQAFDEEGYYRIGDAGFLADPSQPAQGVIFNGRVAEDFKLSTGTWVSVGTLRVKLVSMLAPHVQDIVLTGHDRDEIGMLVFASPQGAALAPQAMGERIAGVLRALRDEGAGSSQCPACALVLAEPPSLDAGEITDKGYINQRAVLTRRAAEVQRLHARTPGDAQVVRLEG